jgi:DNA modification methylase
LHVEVRPIAEVIPYKRNARKIPERAIEKVAASLREFGWRQPIVVDSDGVIIVGHTRLLAAQKLGAANVPVHVATELSAAQVRAYRLMDNRSHEEASWDNSLLGPELVDLKGLDYDLALTGFESSEIKGLLDLAGSVTDGDDDAVPAPQEACVSRPGDLWVLGRHRLLCGDSTSVDAVEQLLGGDRADLAFTDPPYNVDYDPESRPNGPTSADRKSKPLGKIRNDKMSPAAFREFLDAVYSCLNVALKPGAPIYICHADTEGHNFRAAFIDQPWKLQSCLIWKKTGLVFGRADYHWMHEPILYGEKDGGESGEHVCYPEEHEPILYGWKEGGSHPWEGNRKQTTIIEVATEHLAKSTSDTGGRYVHPTQKPVALILIALANSSRLGAVIIDLFGGSGSTMIACEKSGRSARLMELDPKFVDVIVRRWEAFTGQEAVLESDGRTFAQLASSSS